MSTDSQANILIKTEANTAGVNETHGALDRLTGGMGSLVGAFALGNIASNVMMGATAKLGEAFSAVKDQVKESAQVQSQLNAVLLSTHGAAGITAEAANKLAEGISKTTPIDNEAALAAENMLLTFTNIHKDVFPAVTKATMDMATAMNGGATPSSEQLRTTAIQVGKALNDPATGLAKLQKVGVTFTEQQKEQIKTMEAAGNMAGAQKVMTDELAKEFGGSATASAKTFQGQIQMLKNEMIDWGGKGLQKAEELLQHLLVAMLKITQTAKFKDFMHDVSQATQDVLVFLKLLWEALTGGDPTLSKGEARFASLAKVMSQVGYYFDEFRTGVKLVWEALRGGDPTLDKNHLQMGKFVVILDQVMAVIKSVAKVIADVIRTGWHVLQMAIEGLMPSLKALWNALASNIVPVFKEVWDAVTRLYNALQPALGDVLKVIAIVIGVVVYAAIWLFINALRIAIGILAFAVHAIADVVGWIANFVGWLGTAATWTARAVGAIASWFGNLPSMISHVWDDIRKAVSHLIDDLVNFFKTLPDRAVAAVGNIGSRIGNDIKGALHSIHIPGFANGVMNFSGGLAVVGERGPEIVTLPQGANVYPNGTMPAGLSGGGGRQITIQSLIVQAPNNATIGTIMDSIDQDTINASRGLTTVRGNY